MLNQQKEARNKFSCAINKEAGKAEGYFLLLHITSLLLCTYMHMCIHIYTYVRMTATSVLHFLLT